MDKKNIEIEELEMECNYLVDLGFNEVATIRGKDINGYRVFGNLDVYLYGNYVGTLCRKTYKELYAAC